MKNIALGLVALSLSVAAVAGPKCSQPKEKWIPEAKFQSQLKEQGYQIKKFKVTSGNCYEIYGHDKSGKKVEIYFDPATGSPVESK